MCHDLNDGGMLHNLKCFLKVELKNDGFSLRLMTLMYVFITPGQAVLDCMGANEPVLVLVYNFQNNFLKTVCQELRDELEGDVHERDGTIVIYCLGGCPLWGLK
jgi:hypothetical protein